MGRILGEGGRIFIAGPTVENAKEMLMLHSIITGKEVPQLREKRMRDEIVPLVENQFKPAKIIIFNNPVIFSDSKSFLDYYASTLLFEESFNNQKERVKYLKKMKECVDEIIEQKGVFTLNKQVYGILGLK